MSLNKSEQSLHIEPQRSRQLAFLLLMLHGMAMIVVVNLKLDAWIVFALVGSVIVMLICTWHIYVLGQSKKSIKVIVWDADGQWSIVTDNRKSLKADLLPNSYVYPNVIILYFMVDNKHKYSSIIMPDSIDESLFRRLLVRLRHNNN